MKPWPTSAARLRAHPKARSNNAPRLCHGSLPQDGQASDAQLQGSTQWAWGKIELDHSGSRLRDEVQVTASQHRACSSARART